eukprot:9989345-Alexandrium_andersonii.AAC.1
MSASLVGSEMCIRDSWRPSMGFARVTSATCQWIFGLLSDARLRISAGPVSYTHLTLPTICSV